MDVVNVQLKKLWQEEDGLGTLEILLIVAVLVALALIFRKWIVHWFNDLIKDANDELTTNKGATKPCDPTTGC
jgi:hypothetical protein